MILVWINEIDNTIIENINIMDPEVWIRKYLIILSVDILFNSENIIGINAIILISIPIHILNHDGEDKTIIVLNSKKNRLEIIVGLIN